MTTDTPQCPPSEESTRRQLLLRTKRQVEHSRRVRALNPFFKPPSAFGAIIVNCDNKAESDDHLPLQEPGALAAHAGRGEDVPLICDYGNHYSHYFSPLHLNHDIEDEQRSLLEWVHLDILLLGGKPRLYPPFAPIFLVEGHSKNECDRCSNILKAELANEAAIG